MKNVLNILFCILLSAAAFPVWGQADRSDVRRGNRDFRKGDFKQAEIDYRKAVVKDSTSVAAGYNLANTLFRQGDHQGAMKALDALKEEAPMSASAADYFYNLGDAALAVEDYKTAVDAFQQSLLRNPGDLNAKENYIFAKKKLKDQQDQQNQDQNQDDGDQNQDQDQEKNQDNDDQDQNQNKDNQDQNQPQNQNKDDQNQNQQPKITPQSAQQMLQAIQAKEKETQEKVNKKKAEALKSRQKEKNW